jgi:hypothetical protein
MKANPGSQHHRRVFWRWDKHVGLLQDLKSNESLVREAQRFLGDPEGVMERLRPVHVVRMGLQVRRGRRDARKCLGIRGMVGVERPADNTAGKGEDNLQGKRYGRRKAY